jgi:pSer/pThr/pTyr-binding forkhead associated (FHA) protein
MSGETRRLDDETDPTQPLESRATALPPLKTLPVRLTFQVLTTGDTIVVPVQTIIVLGRKDPTHRIQPDLDLAPYRGYQCGVSRGHAVIVVKDDDLWIRALTATNGTFVNNVALNVGQDHLLRDGDELRLGVLRLRVTFVSSAVSTSM